MPWLDGCAALSVSAQTKRGSGRHGVLQFGERARQPRPRQSGSRLKVVWLSGQYQRAIRVPVGVLRTSVPCRAREQLPSG